MSSPWYGGDDAAEDPFEDGTIQQYDQSLSALNDESTPMQMDEDIYGMPYEDAFGSAFPGADASSFTDQQMDNQSQFTTPHDLVAFGTQHSFHDQPPANDQLSPYDQSPNQGQLMPYDQLSFQDNMSPYTQPPSYSQTSFHVPHGSQAAGSNTQGLSMAEPEASIKEENNSQDDNAVGQVGDDDYIPNLGADDSDHDEHYAEQTEKTKKVNKDGRSRKVRQPRGHLRRWDENDLSKALLGIVWACGESGVSIPFAQAAKLIDSTCTASALQQAILKIQSKLNSEGAQIPKIKMNWPKKNESVAEGKTGVRDNGKVPRKKPTLTQATQCNITSLRGATGQYILATAGIGDHAPHSIVPAPTNIIVAAANIAPGPSNIANNQNVPAQSSQGGGVTAGPVASTQSARRSRRRTHAEMMNEEGRRTPLQPQRSPVCPPAPRRIREARLANASPARRLFAEAHASPLSGFGSFRQGRMNPFANSRAQPIGFSDHSPFSSMPFNVASRNNNMHIAAQQGHSNTMPFNFHGFERNIDTPNGIQGSYQFSGSSGLFGSDSTVYNVSSMGATSQDRKAPAGPDRKDSLFPSNSQSTASSQQGHDHQTRINLRNQTPTGQDDHAFMAPDAQMSPLFGYSEQGIRQQNEGYITRINAAASERPTTAWLTHPTTVGFRQQPRPRLSLGMDILANPFGGNFDDAFDNAYTPSNEHFFEEAEAMSGFDGSAFPEVSGEAPADNGFASHGTEMTPIADEGNFGDAAERSVIKTDSSPARYDYAGAFNMR